MSRVVKVAVVEFADAAGVRHTAVKGAVIAPSSAEETRLEGLGAIGLTTDTPASIEAAAQAKQLEYQNYMDDQRHVAVPAFVAAAQAVVLARFK